VNRPAIYRADLARVQHLGFADFARCAAPALLRLLHEAGIPKGKVVDLGCGSGVWLRALARAGFAAVGVDASPSLVRIAHRVAPGAELHVASIYRFALPRCDAVTALGEVLNYCPAGRRRKPPLTRLFERVAEALRPGGLFVFDLLVRGAPMGYRTWKEGNSWAVLVDVQEDPAQARVTRAITTFRRSGRGYRRSHETHILEVHSRAEVSEWLRAAGFAVSISRRYGAFELGPRRLAFRARRVGRWRT
jgi:SAM-dependent methyltransferase